MRQLTASAVVVVNCCFHFVIIAPPAWGAQLYWTDFANNRIRRSNLDGSGLQTVLGSLPGATALAIDNTNGKMYWSETIGPSRIRRANLDGSNVELVLNAAAEIYDIALDPEENLMFFAQGSSPIPEIPSAIRAATLAGGSPHDLVSGSKVNPYAVALFDAQVYYPGEGGNNIRRVNYDGTGDQSFLEAAGGGVFALHFPKQSVTPLYWLDEDDDYLRGDDDHYSLFSMQSVGPAGERNPWGLVSEGDRLYWTDATLGRVQSVNPNVGADDYEFFSVEGQPRRLALAVPEPGVATTILAGLLCFRRRRE
jgi:hypothetical protein